MVGCYEQVAGYNRHGGLQRFVFHIENESSSLKKCFRDSGPACRVLQVGISNIDERVADRCLASSSSMLQMLKAFVKASMKN